MNLYSVLLVDDEEEVYSVIMKKLDWEAMGFRIAGYARNGVEALEMAEELASHGVGLKHDVWNVVPGSIFHRQMTPSLDYYVRLTKGFYEIMRKYDISTEMDDYRKCGMHPSINLDRI